jgi:hypothetical protein
VPQILRYANKYLNTFIGRVCVPIDPANVESFDPETVPTVSDLINDIGAYDEEHKDAAKGTPLPNSHNKLHIVLLTLLFHRT